MAQGTEASMRLTKLAFAAEGTLRAHSAQRGYRGNPAQPNDKEEMESLPYQLLHSGRNSPRFLVSACFCFCSEPSLVSRQSRLPHLYRELPDSADDLCSCLRPPSLPSLTGILLGPVV